MANNPSNERLEAIPHCWRAALYPACSDFEDNDQGICVTCGHFEECHDNP